MLVRWIKRLFKPLQPVTVLEPKYVSYADVPAELWRWRNFTPKEIACRGTGELVIDEAALDTLQRLREAWGKPMRINSAYRSASHNKNVGGSPNSQHLFGKAFDVAMPKRSQAKFIAAAKEAGFTGIGTYANFVHIDTGRKRSWSG